MVCMVNTINQEFQVCIARLTAISCEKKETLDDKTVVCVNALCVPLVTPQNNSLSGDKTTLSDLLIKVTIMVPCGLPVN